MTPHIAAQRISHQGWEIDLIPGDEPEATAIVALAEIRQAGQLRCTFLRSADEVDGPNGLDSLLVEATKWVDAQRAAGPLTAAW